MTASLRLVSPAAEPEAEPDVGVEDADCDLGSFAMSAASAEQVTVQIRALLERSWEYLALAYQGRAFLALGYATWDAYTDARFGDLRIAVPREHRHHAVAALTGASMSIRAIAKLLGVGVGTVHREITGTEEVPDGPTDSEDPAPSTLGLDGKHYPRHRPIAAPCRTCGEIHSGDPSQCPWELYAQGTGPQPSAPQPGGSEAPASRAHGPSSRFPRFPATARKVTDRKPIQPPNPTDPATNNGTSGLLDTIERAACLLDQLPDFDQRSAELNADNHYAGPPAGNRTELISRVRALEQSLRDQMSLFSGLLHRLGEIAVDLETR